MRTTALTTFFRFARRYLAPSGRIHIFFGASGDLGYLERLVTEQGFRSETMAHADLVKDGLRVEYFIYRNVVPAEQIIGMSALTLW